MRRLKRAFRARKRNENIIFQKVTNLIRFLPQLAPLACIILFQGLGSWQRSARECVKTERNTFYELHPQQSSSNIIKDFLTFLSSVQNVSHNTIYNMTKDVKFLCNWIFVPGNNARSSTASWWWWSAMELANFHSSASRNDKWIDLINDKTHKLR